MILSVLTASTVPSREGTVAGHVRSRSAPSEADFGGPRVEEVQGENRRQVEQPVSSLDWRNIVNAQSDPRLGDIPSLPIERHREFLSGNHRLRRGRQERGLRGAYRARDGSRIGQGQLENDQIRDAISDSMILNIRSDRR